MSNVILPYSMDLAKQATSLNADVEANIQRIRSDGISYAGSDTISITIPTSNSSNFLHSKESFLELKIKPTFSVGAGAGNAVYLDQNMYALFDSVRVYHGSQLLFSTNNVAPLWIALRDCVSNSLGDSIDLGSATNGISGGFQLTTLNTYSLAMCIPIPILGSMNDQHSIPLSLMSSGDIVIELDLNPVQKVLTNRTNYNDASGTAVSTLTSYLITEVYYNMKTSRLPNQISQALKMSYGDVVRFSGQSWASEKVSIAAGSTSISCRLPFRFSSLKGIVWFLQNTSIANGNIVNNNFQQAVGHRTGGKLNQYWCSLDGRDYPSSHVVCTHGSALIEDSKIGFHGASCYSQLKRFLNNLSSGFAPCSLDRNSYHAVANTVTQIQDNDVVCKFVGALDLDRADQSNDEIFQGVNTRNSNITFNATWDTALSETMNLCIYGLYDISFQIENGQVTPYF